MPSVHPSLISLFSLNRAPPPQTSCPSAVGSAVTCSCTFSEQVEILDSYHQTLHRLHGEQVRIRWGKDQKGPRPGNETLEYSARHGGMEV